MNRVISIGTVERHEEVAEGIFLLRLRCPEIARVIRPGQFVNIKALDMLWGPFLRRPFSVSSVEGESLNLLFNVVGSGTRLLASRRPGDQLDVLGPLGRPFSTDGDFSQAVFVAGGLGIAPFPFLDAELRGRGKSTRSFVGARTGGHVYTGPLSAAEVATDDGSRGFHGTVVDLMVRSLSGGTTNGTQIYGCGPTPMLKALAHAASSLGLPCELSLEGDMACGIGLCQGCPVEQTGDTRRYALVCTEGPTFDSRRVVL